MNSKEKYCSICGKEKESLNSPIGKIYRECECERKAEEAAKQKRIEAGKPIALGWHLESSGLEGRYLNYSFDSINPKPEQFDALKKCKELAAQPNHNLIICGTVGSGKTLLAVSIIRELCSKAVTDGEAEWAAYGNASALIHSPYRFARAIDILKSARAGLSGGNGSFLLRECERAQLLVINDIGTSGEKMTEFQESIFLDIIDKRSINERPTIVTTNLTTEELQTCIGSRTYSRIAEGADIAVIASKSFRK